MVERDFVDLNPLQEVLIPCTVIARRPQRFQRIVNRIVPPPGPQDSKWLVEKWPLEAAVQCLNGQSEKC